MKATTRTILRITGAGVLVVLVLILWVRAPRSAAPEFLPLPTAQPTSDPSDAPLPTVGRTSAAPRVLDPSTNSAVGILLHARPGTLTTTEAQQLVADLIASPDFRLTLASLLAAPGVPERLLGVYALLEADGLTDQTEATALHDPSPYVRAEVLNWLFRHQQFAEMDALLLATAGGTDDTSASALIDQLCTHPEAEVPMPLSRLRLGRALPRYVTLLAGSVSNVLVVVEEALASTNTPAASKEMLIDTLASARPADYQELLATQYPVEPDITARMLLARNLAATISETDAERRRLIEDGLPPALPKYGPPKMAYREQVLLDLADVDARLRSLCEATVSNPAGFRQALETYLRLSRQLGPGAANRDTLGQAVRNADRHGGAFAADAVAEAAYVIQQTKTPAVAGPP